MTARVRLGFLGGWAVFVIGVGLAALVLAAERENWRDEVKLRRLERIDRLIAQRMGEEADRLREISEAKEEKLDKLRSAVARATVTLDDSKDPEQTIIVSTSENRVRVRRRGQTIFEAICSTGKGTTLEIEGRKMIFDTPTGSFRIQSKEENPVWAPPDWHFVEEARKKHLDVVRLNPGETLDAATGTPVRADRARGLWSLVSSGPPRGRVLRLRENTVVEVASDGSERELPPGELIKAGNVLVVPPHGTRQRRFEKILGRYRLNIGNGYGIHGTQETGKLGRSVSHGCVRLSDTDIERLYGLARVGDRVIIY